MAGCSDDVIRDVEKDCGFTPEDVVSIAVLCRYVVQRISISHDSVITNIP